MSNGFFNAQTVPPIKKEGQTLVSTLSGAVWEDPPGQLLRTSWTWTTKANPDANGEITVNAANWAAATQVRMNKISGAGSNVSTILAGFQPNDTLYIQDNVDSTKWGKYRITAAFSDQGTWGYFPVQHLESSGALPANNRAVMMLAEVSGGGGGGIGSISDSTPTSLQGLLVGNGTDIDALPVIDDPHLPGRLKTNSQLVDDWNNAVQSGWYYSPTVPNVPVNGYWMEGLVIAEPGGGVVQFVWQRDGYVVWQRRKQYGTTWLAWQQVFPLDDNGLPPRIQTIGPNITDFNSPTESGWYRPNVGAVNGPAGVNQYGMLWHNEWGGGGHSTQIFNPMYTEQLWWRRRDTYAWQAWHCIWPISDDGLPARLQASFSPAPGNDLNQATSGWSNWDSSTANRPNDAYGVVFTIKHVGGNIARQIAYETSTGTANVFTRWMWGSWSGWVKMFPVDDSNLPGRLYAATSGYAVPGNDWNNATASGFYQGSGLANQPWNTHWHVIVSAHSSGYCAQIAMNLYSNEVYQRYQASGSWSGWVKIYPIDDTNLPTRLRSTAAYADCNNVSSGWSDWGPGNNGPISGYGTCFTIVLDANQRQQIAWRYDADYTWTRKYLNSAWQPWQQVWPLSQSQVPVGDTNLPDRIISQSKQISDWNQAVTTGWYCGNAVANSPPSAVNQQCYGNVILWSSGYVTQVCYPLTSGIFEIWQRQMVGGSWTGWQKLAPPDDQTLPARLRSTTWQNTVSDANNAQQTGWYGFPMGSANLPYNQDWHCQVLGYNNINWTIQIAYLFTGREIWIRNNYAGTWQPWLKVFPIDNTNLPTRIRGNTTSSGGGSSEVTDWNSARENGWYQGPPGTANAPENNWFLGHVVAHRDFSPAYITQRVWRFTDNTGVEYRRNCINDGWSGWWRSDTGALAGLSIYADDYDTYEEMAMADGSYYLFPSGRPSVYIPVAGLYDIHFGCYMAGENFGMDKRATVYHNGVGWYTAASASASGSHPHYVSRVTRQNLPVGTLYLGMGNGDVVWRTIGAHQRFLRATRVG